MATQAQTRIIPIYNSQGEADAFLVYPYIFNRSGEYIGWVTPQREVYSVMGYYVGSLTNDPRIIRKRAEDSDKPHMACPPTPKRISPPAQVPLAPMMQELSYGIIDVLAESPELLHTLDSGDLRQDMD
ncbi:MAG: hypothetical protein CNIPEHKO_01354 [Anaerolineales bacterium]|nr:hypothetical protein [Anaerolineales bacterium]